MISSDKPLLDLLQGQKGHRCPVWIMRQAGRYLPEYRDLRAQAGSFLDLCLSPQKAAEVTLQPLRRFDLDAAILFADILLVPFALGQDLTFVEGEGPRLSRVRDLDDLSLSMDRIEPVFETIRLCRRALAPQQTLLGFCGAPWTVACYMIEGRGQSDFTQAAALASLRSVFLDELIGLLIRASYVYLENQIKAGAEALVLFESWAGLLKGATFDRYVIQAHRALTDALKQNYPHIPIMGFPRGATPDDYIAFAKEAGVVAMAIDPSLPRDFARRHLSPLMPLHGNMDPQILVRGGEDMLRDGADLLDHFADAPKGHVFSLGHGLLPQTPVEHVAAFVRMIREQDGKAAR